MRPLTQRRLRAALEGVGAGPFGENVHFYASIPSTNDILRGMAAADAPEGTLVVADEQTAGRGRMGRTWEAPAATSLLVSVLFRPDIPASHLYQTVMASGLAAAEAVENVAGIAVEVKWPNDLQIGGKKVGGILPESAIVGERPAWVIVGLGLNVNQLYEPGDPLHGAATSLHAETGSPHDRAALLAGFAVRLNRWHGLLMTDELVDAWRARCVTLGQRLRLETPAGVVEGLAEDIGPEGALWLRDDAGERRQIAAGEASVRAP